MSGIPCPHCGSDTGIKETRRSKQLGMPIVRRRHYCMNKRCRFRFSTEEFIGTVSAHVPDLRRHLLDVIRASQAALAILSQFPSKGKPP